MSNSCIISPTLLCVRTSNLFCKHIDYLGRSGRYYFSNNNSEDGFVFKGDGKLSFDTSDYVCCKRLVAYAVPYSWGTKEKCSGDGETILNPGDAEYSFCGEKPESSEYSGIVLREPLTKRKYLMTDKKEIIPFDWSSKDDYVITYENRNLSSIEEKFGIGNISQKLLVIKVFTLDKNNVYASQEYKDYSTTYFYWTVNSDGLPVNYISSLQTKILISWVKNIYQEEPGEWTGTIQGHLTALKDNNNDGKADMVTTFFIAPQIISDIDADMGTGLDISQETGLLNISADGSYSREQYDNDFDGIPDFYSAHSCFYNESIKVSVEKQDGHEFNFCYKKFGIKKWAYLIGDVVADAATDVLAPYTKGATGIIQFSTSSVFAYMYVKAEQSERWPKG